MKRLNISMQQMDDGRIVVNEPTIFNPSITSEAPKHEDLIVLIDDPAEPDLQRNYGEWDGKHWRYVGDLCQIIHPVVYWAYPPAVPPIPTEMMEVAA